MEEYNNFFKQFIPVEKYHTNWKSPNDVNLFGLAFIEAGKHSDMSMVPKSLKMFKAVTINDAILFGNIITRECNSNQYYTLGVADVTFSLPYTNDFNIPPSVEYVEAYYTIKIPSTVKYLTIVIATRHFVIDTELEYLCVYAVFGNGKITTTKPIKFLSIGCLKCLNNLAYITPYVKYLIIRGVCHLDHDRKHIYSLNMLEGVFIDDKCKCIVLDGPVYTFREVDENFDNYIECIRYLFN
jgi:hypothetical protein